MNRTQKTWGNRWNGFWNKQKETQFASVFYIFAGTIGTLLAIHHYRYVACLVGLLGMVAVNLWIGHFRYCRPVSAIISGIIFTMFVTTGGHRPLLNPAILNELMLGTLIVAMCSIIFANHGKTFASHVQMGLENLAWGAVFSLGLTAVYGCLHPNFPWWLTSFEMVCLLNLHFGTARAGGWEPGTAFLSLGTRHRTYGSALETQ